jgi:ABC-2 type transport system permease protein
MMLPKLNLPRLRRPALRQHLKVIAGGLTGRTARRKAHAWIYAVAVLGLFVLVNVVANRFAWRLDLTREGLFSLAPQTKELLANLPGDVRVLGFYEAGSPQEGYMSDLLREFAQHSRGRLTWEAVDPATNPSLVRQYEISWKNTTLLLFGEKQEKLDEWDLMSGFDPLTGRPQINGEQALTNALIRLTAGEMPKVYFLEGHGEQIFGKWKKQMQAESYPYEPVNFAVRGGVPEESGLLVIAGPARDFTEQEIVMLQTWLHERGGRLLVMVDPHRSLPNLEAWLGRWGITLYDTIAIDPMRAYMQDVRAVVPQYRYHAITSKIDSARLAMVLPGARSLSYDRNAEGLLFSELLVTSDAAWGETDRTRIAKDSEDMAGPLTLAVAVTREIVEASGDTPARPEARLVVIGSAGFAADDVLAVQGNLDFAMSAIGWLTDQGRSVTIRPPEMTQSPLFFTQRDMLLIFTLTVAVLPSLFLLAGGFIWLRRRHA